MPYLGYLIAGSLRQVARRVLVDKNVSYCVTQFIAESLAVTLPLRLSGSVAGFYMGYAPLPINVIYLPRSAAKQNHAW